MNEQPATPREDPTPAPEGLATPREGPPPAPQGPATARELVRRRRRDYRAPDTGRHHHLGSVPERQPLLGEQGAEYVETAAAQLAERTVLQLERQREHTHTRMEQAALELDFEAAARLRDALAAVDGELARRRR